MPRAPVEGRENREIRRRSRNGCWNCKARKVKCGEEKPQCSNCKRLDEVCDYSIRLSWGGRPLKKKQMLNGEEQTEDDSMFLPGAGQFSIHQQFPQQQTFVPQAGTNGTSTSRKPPVARPGKKSGSMSSYQTVFSVQEPSGPSPATPTVSSPEGHPQRSNQSSSSPSQRAGSSYYSWTDQEHSQTSSPTVVGSPPSVSTYPHTTVFKQEPLEPENVFTERTPFPSFSPISPYMSQIPSPTFSKVNLPSPLSPPYSHQSQSLVSPQHQHAQKALHPPPSDFSIPPKRMRTVAPSTPLPLYYPTNYVNGPIHSAPPTIPSPYQVFFNPTSVERTAQEYNLPSIDTNNGIRLVPVARLISPPLQNDGALYSYHRNNHLDYSSGRNVTFGTANEEADGNDDDVEVIPRYDSNGYGDAYGYRMRAVSNYPTTLTIPRGLDPLPSILLDNEKNMMYFKHFLGFTARLLVPHDCSENPFKKVLPQMAVGTEKLMNLLLAYSASHQARLLNDAEPTDRINEFLQETIKDLNVSLNDEAERGSDSTLATLIMLCSYDIISPNKLISWRQHLNAAREIILTRGETEGTEGIHCRDNVTYFLVRWFAYLDIVGSLSGRDNDKPLFSGKYWINDEADENEDSAVDCVLGFTSKCVSIMAKIGELARRSDQLKKIYYEDQTAGVNEGPQGFQGIVKNWKPPADIEVQARELENELEYVRNQMGETAGAQFTCETNSRRHKHNHAHSHHDFVRGDPNDDVVNKELLATNDAFHLAASVHLYRRVLNYPSEHPKVQRAVASIIGAMHNVRLNGDAENCLIFPLFTAGCEAVMPVHRAYTLKRMQAVEKIGMTQVTAARLLMERAWAEGVPWETLSDGEFIG